MGFGAKIWREVEKRKAKGRKIVKLEEELSKTQSKIKELKEMNTNMNTLIADNKMVLIEILSSKWVASTFSLTHIRCCYRSWFLSVKVLLYFRHLRRPLHTNFLQLTLLCTLRNQLL